MLAVLDPAVHVDAAAATGIALDRGVGIHHVEFFGPLAHLELVTRHDGHLREQRARRLPALGASAHVIVRRLGANLNFHGIARALAGERASSKARRARLYAIVDRWMNGNLCHTRSSLVCRRHRAVPWRFTTFLRPRHANEI